MSVEYEKKTETSWGVDTFQLAQAALLFALTYTSDLPWWKWILFIGNYAGFEYRTSRKIKSIKGE